MRNQNLLVKYLRHVEHHMRFPLAVACAYEAVAIFSQKVPTITELCSRTRWVAPAVGAMVTWHLLATPGEKRKHAER